MLNKKRKIIIAVFILLVIIAIGLIIIVLPSPNKPSIAIKPQLKNYDKLIVAINQINNLSTTQNGEFQKMIEQLRLTENPNLTRDQQFQDLRYAQTALIGAYVTSNDHTLYSLQKTLADFMTLNFPDKKKQVVEIVCFDPICAPKQPKMVTDIVSEIKASNTLDVVKQGLAQDLNNASYFPDDDPQRKASNYLLVANAVKYDPDFIKAGINDKIANEILDFIKQTYPEQFAQITLAPVKLHQ